MAAVAFERRVGSFEGEQRCAVSGQSLDVVLPTVRCVTSIAGKPEFTAVWVDVAVPAFG